MASIALVMSLYYADVRSGGMIRYPAITFLVIFLVWWFFIRIPPSNSLKGRRLLITGAAHGLGKAIAILAASRGATLVLWDIDGAALEEVAAEARGALRETGHDVGPRDRRAVQTRVVDVGSESEIEDGAKEAMRGQNGLDSVVSCAGVLNGVSAGALTGAALSRVLAVNVGGPFSLYRHFLPHMLAGAKGADTQKGTFVFLGSVMGALGAAQLADYAASKAALHGMCDSLRQELNREGLRGKVGVHLVCPWILGDTEMFQGAYSKRQGACCSRTVLRIIPPLKSPILAGHVLDGLAFSHGSHWVTYLPLITRYATLLPKFFLSPSLSAYDALLGAVGGSHGMEGWRGSLWNTNLGLAGVKSKAAGTAAAATSTMTTSTSGAK